MRASFGLGSASYASEIDCGLIRGTLRGTEPEGTAACQNSERFGFGVFRYSIRSVIKMGMSSGASENASATDLADLVLEVIKEMSPAGVTELKPDTKLVAELDFDSLGLVELMVALEDSLDLPPLDVTAVEGITQVADVQRVVSEAQARMPPD